jgi:hypothetical protein
MQNRSFSSLLPRWLQHSTASPSPLAVGVGGEAEAILYRILSTDLPPLIPAGTVQEQLRFILEHEPDHPGLSKRWLLNRLPDPDQRNALVDLLEKHRQCWWEIPFEGHAYAECWTDIGTLPESLHPWGHDFAHLLAAEQAEVLNYLARNKILYLLNRNNARNWAVENGLKDSPWVFPWDGACFLTNGGWQAIRPLLKVAELAYVAVPMAEVIDEDALLQASDEAPKARLTPQLGFSRNAQEHFQPQLREGPLIDHVLLQSLSLPGPWLEPEAPLGICPWEAIDITPAPDRARLVQAGWTYQLLGRGLPHSEASKGGEARQKLNESIRVLTRRTDMALIGQALKQGSLRCWTALEGTPPPLPELATIAANARTIPRSSLTDKELNLPGKSASHRYVNAVPHWQRLSGSENAIDRSTLLGLNPANCGDVSQSYDRARLQLMVDCVCSLALDGHLNANPASYERATELLRTWFIDPATSMIPDGSYARLSAVDPSRNVLDAAIDFRDVYPLLDAIRLVEMAGCLSTIELQQLEEWLDAFLGWLSNDSADFLKDHSASPACTWYHLLLLAIATYRGKRNMAAQVLDNLPGLLAKQFRPDGSPQSCPPDALLRHNQLFNLQGWANLVVISSTLGRNLLTFTDSNGHSLQQAFAHAKRLVQQDHSPHGDRFTARQWLETIERCLHPEAAVTARPPIPPLAEASTGLPPFWILCRPLSPPKPSESSPSPPPHWPGS